MKRKYSQFQKGMFVIETHSCLLSGTRSQGLLPYFYLNFVVIESWKVKFTDDIPFLQNIVDITNILT